MTKNTSSEPISKASASSPGEIEAAKNKAWNAANRDLREAEPTQWQTFLRQRYHEAGLKWNPRPSKEDRDRAALAELIGRYPLEAQDLVAAQEQPSDS